MQNKKGYIKKSDSPSQRFAANIIHYCEIQEIKHGDVSEALGNSKNYLNKIARGEGGMPLDKAVAYADHLGLYVSDILFDGDMGME